jgi:HNH endonuclease
MDVWRVIPSTGGKYEASLSGKIRACGRTTIRRAYAGRHVHLGFGFGTKLVHRLVCEAFHGKAPVDKPHAAHADGNPLNHGAFNLYWATPKENEADKLIHGTWGSRYSGAKLAKTDVLAIREKAAKETKAKNGRWRNRFVVGLAEEYGVTAANIYAILHYRSWRDLGCAPKSLI